MKLKSILILLLSALSLTVFAQKPKIAVYMTGDDSINGIVSDRLMDDFTHSNEYTTVERTASFLTELAKEHAYERNGEVDDEQIATLGKQFNVQYVCVVSVLDVWKSEKYITARIIDVETAEVVATGSSNGSIQNSSELIDALNSLSGDFLKAMRYNKQNNAKKVAVYVTKTGNRDVDVVLGDQLVAGFVRSGRYNAIERTNSFLKKLKDEQDYQQSGAVDDDDLTRWGQQFGVQYVCVTKSTSWDGDYFITTRMVDVKTGEVVNSYKIEGRKLANSRDVVRVAQEIASELSKGTLAEQQEEERLKAEAEEAEKKRLRAEQEKAMAEEKARIEAQKRAEREAEERLLREEEEEIAYINSCKQQGYLILETRNGRYMIDLEVNNTFTSFNQANKTYSKYGRDGWRLPYKDEMFFIVGALYSSRYGVLCKKHSRSIGLLEGRKYWCINGKNLRYYQVVRYYGYNVGGVEDGPSDDYTFAFAADYYAKVGIEACAFYVIKL